MKIFRWIKDNFLFSIVLFLLAFIPLYPKKPLLDIVNTWVYVRAEDFVVVGVLLIWILLLIRKKITLKTPLTMPILLFWIVGAISTIHGVLLIFPTIANVFPNVALLSFVRHIEYLSLFFVAFSAIKDRKYLKYIVAVLVITLFAVVVYGIGQKYAGFPAYLTMNEEFAKGEAIRLSSLSRVPSTFGGHYDLAAYLVLIIPFMASLFFGVRNLVMKFIFLAAVGSGIVLLYLTVSRVSFFVLFMALALVLFLQKRKWFVFSLPIAAIFFAVFLLNFAPRLIDRFGNTVKEINVLVDAETGEALGNIVDIKKDFFLDKTVKKRFYRGPQDINTEVRGLATGEISATVSGIVPFKNLPKTGVLLVPPNASTGENLPQGTGYVNLPLSPVREQRNEFFYVYQSPNATTSAEVQMFVSKFLVKKALAYDLSFTTRFQGEWPHAIDAFKRNVFLGSGYSSISLAVDNNYLRMLGEVGLFGFISFFVILVAIGAYIKQILPKIDSPFIKSFVIGFAAGVFGLILNAFLIDVFEASKVAFYLWLLTGVTIGVLHTYQTKPFAIYSALKKVMTSTYAIVIYLAFLTFFMYSSMLSNYFVGDDFTWFRWAANHDGSLGSILQYFVQSDGFFYRPGAKIYFLLMYSAFWLNPVIYHVVSLIFHFVVVLLVFFLARKVLRDLTLTILATFLFAVLSGYHETIFWISSVGHIFSTMFVLLSILLFSFWDEKKKIVYFILSLISIAFGLMFHELGVVAPLLIIFYKFVSDKLSLSNIKSKKGYYALLFSPLILYLGVRYLSNSHWFGGDYSYNLLKLPLNFVGNFAGYLLLSGFGPLAFSFYESLRNVLRSHLLLSIVITLIIIVVSAFTYRFIKKIDYEDKRLIIFGFGFMVLSLLPFLGLGNIASRYNYLVTFGFVILFALLVKKLYGFLINSGRDVAIASMSLFIGLFFLLHIIQIQKVHGDWHDAGLKVNRFFISIESNYLNHWSNEGVKLHFIDIPIRNGDAWVFPVGLEDAVWFAFRSPKIIVYQGETLSEALSQINDPAHEKVFVFQDDGQIVEKYKPKPK